MEFLVEIEVRLPGSLQEDEIDELINKERRYGASLMATGVIHRIWRLAAADTPSPRHFRNVGIWAPRDEAELRATLKSLPLAPWMGLSITHLETHPLESPRAQVSPQDSEATEP